MPVVSAKPGVSALKSDLRAASLSKSVVLAWDATRPQRNSDANRKDTGNTAIYRKKNAAFRSKSAVGSEAPHKKSLDSP